MPVTPTVFFRSDKDPDKAKYASLSEEPITGTAELIKSFAPLLVRVSTEFVNTPFNVINDIKNDETSDNTFVTVFLINKARDEKSRSFDRHPAEHKAKNIHINGVRTVFAKDEIILAAYNVTEFMDTAITGFLHAEISPIKTGIIQSINFDVISITLIEALIKGNADGITISPTDIHPKVINISFLFSLSGK